MKVQHNADLQPFHTFALPARAAAWCVLTDAAQLPDVLSLPDYQRDTVLWLGGGSNVLFCQDYPGLVVKMANKGIQVVSADDDTVVVDAAAGEVWHDFVRYTVAQGWNGLENLSLIPGTVGAAPVQNIGAYGVEVQSAIDSVWCFDLVTQHYVRLDKTACRFAYRNSIFKQEGKQRYVIVSVRFALSRHFSPQMHYGDVAQIAEDLAQGRPLNAELVSQAVCQIRRSKLPDPTLLGNAGSFFKNPLVDAVTAEALLAAHPQLPHYPQPDGTVKLAAGWLIDQCGLKGFQLGGAAVHDRQALVLVNKNHATAADVVALARHVQHAVQQRFGVTLSPEPIWLPPSAASATHS